MAHMNARHSAGSIALVFALSNCAPLDNDALVETFQQATIATPSTTGPVCTFVGGEGAELQVSCARKGFEDSIVTNPRWYVLMLSDEAGRPGVARSTQLRAVVTPALGRASGAANVFSGFSFAMDTEIPRSFYEQAAQSVREANSRNCQVTESRQLQQLAWEFRFSCQ
jgi:hypothetical protein